MSNKLDGVKVGDLLIMEGRCGRAVRRVESNTGKSITLEGFKGTRFRTGDGRMRGEDYFDYRSIRLPKNADEIGEVIAATKLAKKAREIKEIPELDWRRLGIEKLNTIAAWIEEAKVKP